MCAVLISWEVRVSGRVQGVFYRVFTRDTAHSLGVNGWVRNEPGGSVSALVQHRDEAVLQQMVAAMRQGPSGARVDDCLVRELEQANSYTTFEIRYN